MKAGAFNRARNVLMRGWELADDGRLYHPTVTQRVLMMLDTKQKEKDRKAAYRAKKAASVQQMSHGTDAGQTQDGRGIDPGRDATGTGTGTGLKEKETEANASVVGSRPASDRLPCPHQEILALWAEILPELPQPRTWGADRERALRSRWNETAKRLRWESREQGIEWFVRMFRYIRKSPFLMGETPRSEGHEAWTCTLPFVLQPAQFAKIIDGDYHAKEDA